MNTTTATAAITPTHNVTVHQHHDRAPRMTIRGVPADQADVIADRLHAAITATGLQWPAGHIDVVQPETFLAEPDADAATLIAVLAASGQVAVDSTLTIRAQVSPAGKFGDRQTVTRDGELITGHLRDLRTLAKWLFRPSATGVPITVNPASHPLVAELIATFEPVAVGELTTADELAVVEQGLEENTLRFMGSKEAIEGLLADELSGGGNGFCGQLRIYDLMMTRAAAAELDVAVTVTLTLDGQA